MEKQAALGLREDRDLHQALYAAAQLQRKLCAPRDLHRSRFEIASEIFPARHLSGDFSVLVEMGEALGLVVGDIAGKGVTAGLWFTSLVGLVRIHSCSLENPAAAIEAINRDLYRFEGERPTAALFVAWLNLMTGEVVYCNAGQPPPLLIGKDRRVQTLEEGGPILGVIPNAPFTNGRMILGPGDTLVSFSDGVTECRNFRDEEFNSTLLTDAVLNCTDSSAVSMLFSILGAVQDFSGGRPQCDDITLMVVRHKEHTHDS